MSVILDITTDIVLLQNEINGVLTIDLIICHIIIGFQKLYEFQSSD